MKISDSLKAQIIAEAHSFYEACSGSSEQITEEVIYSLDLEEKYAHHDYDKMFAAIEKIIKHNVK